MDKQSQSRTPLIVAIVLLLLPVLYVGSYLALVLPQGRVIDLIFGVVPHVTHYRVDGYFASQFYWPLEQIDRKVRPAAWEPELWHYR